MIPKIIHYCWFGGNELPESVKKCIASWKKYCPDYEIKRWDESNWDVNCTRYTSEAAEAGMWAFLSDYARLDIIYNNGGIYLDTDVEVIKNLDSLLENECFLATEVPSHLIATGLGFGAVKGSAAVKEMLDEYEGESFIIKKGIYNLKPCPQRNSAPFYKYGFTKELSEPIDLGIATVYSSEYFCPYNRVEDKLDITEKTYSVHNYEASWMTAEERDFGINYDKYAETHSRLRSFIYKQYRNCQIDYGKVTPVTMAKLFVFKIRRKIYTKR